jgi:hypothetical protein
MPLKPTEHEDDYFARIEQELIKQVAERKKSSQSKEEKEQLRELHYMKCPKCGMDLVELDFKGMLIDECPTCKGIWLDAGEFDSLVIIEKSSLDKLFKIFKR